MDTEKKKIALLIDMDGVIVDWYQQFLNKWKHDHRIEKQDLKNFYCVNDYPEHHRDEFKSIILGKGFYEDIPFMEGAKEALLEIWNDPEIEPYICTAPDLDCVGQTCWTEKALWVEKNLGKDWLKRLMIVKDKSLVFGTYLIDDKPNMTGAMINNTPEGTWAFWERIVFDHAYNKETPGLRMTWKDWPQMREVLLKRAVGSISDSESEALKEIIGMT